MKFVLLFIAFGQTPTQLGMYDSLELCQKAIRQIYYRQMVPQGVTLSPETLRQIDKAVDLQVQYDQKYQCQPTR